MALKVLQAYSVEVFFFLSSPVQNAIRMSYITSESPFLLLLRRMESVLCNSTVAIHFQVQIKPKVKISYDNSESFSVVLESLLQCAAPDMQTFSLSPLRTAVL